MKRINLTFKELIEGKKLTFLVGAGCSIDPPSNLPAGRKMMEALIKYSCAESEINRIIEMKELRFEQLVEIIQDRLDPKLRIIDYYGLCDTPNLQHFFLAEMLKKGHFVMTTNFDFLIEYALQKSGISNNDIVPVITKEDYQKYSDPEKYFSEGKKMVYKIHGSKKNIITNEDTRKSLIATIQSLGKREKGENLFYVEPFKRTLFQNITKYRTLLIMGYSGSDDFDIIPTLKALKNIKEIIWINHNSKIKEEIQISSINNNYIQKNNEFDRINSILIDLYKNQHIEKIYKVNANTSNLIGKFINIEPKLSSRTFSINLESWLNKNIASPDKYIQFYIPGRIYYNFNKNKYALNCFKEINSIAIEEKNLIWKAIALNNIGLIYRFWGDYSPALSYLENAVKIDDQLSDFSGKAKALNNIGSIYKEQSKYKEALKKFKEALKIAKKYGNESEGASYLGNIGEIYRIQGKYEKARDKFNEALKIDEQQGNLSGKADHLNGLGHVYMDEKNFSEALCLYEDALKIHENLGNFSKKAVCINNIGELYRYQRNFSKALNWYKKALEIADQIGNLYEKAVYLSNIGDIYEIMGDYYTALNHFMGAVEIAAQLGNLYEKAVYLSNIGNIYNKLGISWKSREYLNKAILILEEAKLKDHPTYKILKKNMEFLNGTI